MKSFTYFILIFMLCLSVGCVSKDITTTTWSELHPAGMQPHGKRVFIEPTLSYIKEVQMGLRSDGVIVWRNK